MPDTGRDDHRRKTEQDLWRRDVQAFKDRGTVGWSSEGPASIPKRSKPRRGFRLFKRKRR